MKCYSISEKGRREQNEDNLIEEKLNELYLFAVADGLGGQSFGGIASKIAIGELREVFKRKGQQSLIEGFNKANRTIFDENDRRKTNMGTTLVACLINVTTGDCVIAHVGDSRAYYFSDAIWKTKDHREVQALVDNGIISQEEAFQHPKRNILTRSLGLQKKIQVDFDIKKVNDAVILLCSDGLSDYVKEEELAVIAQQQRPKEACETLVKKALENGSTDNITVIIINCKE